MAHAVVNVAGDGELLHGAAIRIGLDAELFISQKKHGLSREEADRVRATLGAFGLPLTLPAHLKTDDLISAAAKDKKFSAGQIRFVVVPRLGDAKVADNISEQDLREAI
ncbi:MAG: hypothetical protein ACKOKC_16790 [Chthoniobacterales bacterium]